MKSFKNWLNETGMGFGPYIGNCKPTADYQIFGACSDQKKQKKLKKEETISEEKTVIWNARKKEIIDYWSKLRNDVPILIRPINANHTGSTYGEDGIRITGSSEFIGSVLPRLKEFLNFESPTKKLGVVYRQTKSSNLSLGPAKTSYVFYISVKERGIQKNG